MKNKGIVPILFLCGFLVIIATLFITVLGSEKDTKRKSKEKQEVTESVSLNELSAIVVSRNKEDNSITLKNMSNGQEVKLTVTGGSDIRDKYNQAITLSSLGVGEIVKATYKEKTGTLISLRIQEEYFTYKGVNNWYIDEESNSIYIADNRYRYYDTLLISRGDELLSLDKLSTKDELIVRGKEKEIFSIEVTKGHGTIKVSDYEDFIGGIAYIGKREIIPIVEDMVITARVGTFDLTFEHEDLVGSKSVTLETDKEITVSMEEFKRPPVKMGKVQFHIRPNGSDLYINDSLYSYENPIDLEYGNYNLKVSLGGFSDYTGKLEVMKEETSIYIDLVETSTGKSEEGDTSNGNENTLAENDNENSDVIENENNENNENDNELDDDNEEDTTVKGYIYIQKPAGASVYFDGEFMGSAPVAFKKEVGTHYVTFIQTGYETKTYTVVVLDDGKDLELSFPTLLKTE